ncbi:YadA-like family protein [Burkholderia cenocepacia]|uniref:YadA-like family protein n=1 Tax=Burkholderia cenocepacia TaxID=95486 RepID=A0ABD4UD53_9BURK|nr:YadA-like family protein [Burkholderia cenocepacia]MCW3696304.1 YadA-like family protein [Burkholderia cenocepacia]MCW3704477.1 YadA-like family protein [Burkholderia cenocepacia]MCW3712084.1 YadA-like family protein [Burkholderia cenocepacia]MCW3720083.1 YadA-like family protein [Burkholderia cenocepacia]MCW3727853.1 YadA-like family protein [Burkholderia cenocepacia]
MKIKKVSTSAFAQSSKHVNISEAEFIKQVASDKTVVGQQAVAIGVAWQVGGNAMVNVKAGYAGKMGGASVGYTKAF